MAVQILNEMPDAAVHRGDPPPLRSLSPPAFNPPVSNPPAFNEWAPRAASTKSGAGGRPLFAAVTIGIHLAAALAFLSIRHASKVETPPALILATIIDAPATTEEAPPVTPPLQKIEYVLPMPEQISIEVETITPPAAVTTAAITPNVTQAVVAPMVESVEYVRAPAPVYPRESSRRRESGTVLLRVLVDAMGRPAQIQLERSSGFDRLDVAAREAVLKALFRPHEVNGIAQPAQVLIPIEFTRRTT
jgi:protein TonB